VGKKREIEGEFWNSKKESDLSSEVGK